ncbi:NAD(P)/FAD-dependent oxidoreductase [Nostocoides sp. F2B08]|uniref:NAD(P)/FAD-dependent oxidoreductase n=1 Tax=Nostocoides sp. F2B08 TaxID=2653936 RepID=UPI0012636729|nr:FAD-dependent oxidoreductase [Tetrasphaera sp. F2B08]KAB7744073.1 NAD(P)/FAD-dependent oxidoreductase [Tetrasphaera sp. F2B08]
MSTPRDIVIIGGGLAGAKTAEALRSHGYPGTITLLAGEPHLPYERPPMSKGYLADDDGFEGALVHPAEWYDEQRIDLRTGTRATAVDADAHEVSLDDGTTLGYGTLVLATGSTPRALPLDGADAQGVLTLRTREDSDAIKATFGEGKRLVIIGGGWIGLEVAASARRANTEVTIIEASELPLLGVLGPEMAQVFADLHTENGVDLRLNASVEAVTTDDGRATGVRLEGGETIPADAVVVGIGVTPDTSLAEACGLAVDDGVLVDASLRTSNPDIFAVGDIAHHDHPVLGRRIRVEHWATALNQPESVAKALMGEDDCEYAELPYFFSDQYDLGMEYIGHAPKGSYDKVVIRGDKETREFVAFWLDADNRILAAMNVNVWDVVDEVKPIIAAGTPVDPDRLADPTVAYADLA